MQVLEVSLSAKAYKMSFIIDYFTVKGDCIGQFSIVIAKHTKQDHL